MQHTFLQHSNVLSNVSTSGTPISLPRKIIFSLNVLLPVAKSFQSRFKSSFSLIILLEAVQTTQIHPLSLFPASRELAILNASPKATCLSVRRKPFANERKRWLSIPRVLYRKVLSPWVLFLHKYTYRENETKS